MGLDILGVDKVGIVGRYQRNAEFFADSHQFIVDFFKFGRIVV